MGRVTSSSSGGNVNIQDTYGNPLTSTGGSLNVNITGDSASSTAILHYAEVDSVAMGGTSTILTYTVPAGKTLTFNKINVSSTSICSFELDINGSTSQILRVGFGGPYNEVFDLTGYSVPTGTVVLIKGTNFSQNDLATFDATLIGSLI